MTTTLLQRSKQFWHENGGLDTAKEIAQQPAMWCALQESLLAEMPEVTSFLGDCLADPQQRVILTGAGSSAYVGQIVVDLVNSDCAADVRAVATTSLLTHPELYLDPAAPILLVSFGRSGDSPESLAVIELVRETVPAARFLNITCNAEGRLARQSSDGTSVYTLFMPAASCDRGFAMTSSFSCMLLASLCVLCKDVDLRRLTVLAELADVALDKWSAPISALADDNVERVVYLGSGPLEGLAREAALKILELTGGQVLALSNSALGFRHGPKSALNGQTLVVLFGCAKPLARRYEQDLLDELVRDKVAGRIVTVGPGGELGLDVPAWPDAWLAPLWLLMAQQFALHRSARLGLRPDNPFINGTVNRVVRGVTIYRQEQ